MGKNAGWPPSATAPPRTTTDFAHSTSSQLKLTMETAAAMARESFVGGSAVPMPVSSRQQKCADRKTFIRISPQIESDQRSHLQSTAISNLESAVSPRLNVSLYS